MNKKLIKKIDGGLDLIDSISSTETLKYLLFSLSPVVRNFVQRHPSIMNTFLAVVVFLLFWRKRSRTVTEKLLRIIDDKLEDIEVKGLTESKNFQIIFPQIFEALVKEVSEEKSQLFYRYFRNFIKNPEAKTSYHSKLILTLFQMMPEEFDFLSIFYGKIQKEWVKRTKKKGMTLQKARKVVWLANNTQLNYILKNKYSNEKLNEIIDSLINYRIIRRGRISIGGASGMGGITEFGRFFMDYLKN